MNNEDAWLLIGIVFIAFCGVFLAYLFKSEQRDPHERADTHRNTEMSVLRLRIEQRRAEERAGLFAKQATEWQNRSLDRRAEIADLNLSEIMRIEAELNAAIHHTLLQQQKTEQAVNRAAQAASEAASKAGHLLESWEDVYKRKYGAEWGQMEAQVEGKKHLDKLERLHQEKLGQMQIDQRKQLDEWNKKRMEEYGTQETSGQSDSEKPDVRGSNEDSDDGGDA